MVHYHQQDTFDELSTKLHRNVYSSLKGAIRFTLLKRDIEEGYREFSVPPLTVLDVGGGEGLFSQFCYEKGHGVVLLDRGEKMVVEATARLKSGICVGKVTVKKGDFLDIDDLEPKYDLVAMHGSAEWMHDPERAIIKGVELVRPGGVLSLLIFNRTRHILKRGIGGQLLVSEQSAKKRNLTPPGARSAEEVRQLLQQLGKGTILLQSGIRIFQGFFRSIPQELLSEEEWLTQELRYYRTAPFSSLGEHTHFLYRRKEEEGSS